VVTIAVAFVYISGLSSALLGTLVLLSRYQADKGAVLPVSLLGAGIILFGLLTLAVASGVARGSRLSRLLVTIYLAIQLPLHVITIVSSDSWDWVATAEIVIELYVLFALWAPPGSRHFVAAPVAAAEPSSAPAP
jgi:hypothetical protein